MPGEEPGSGRVGAPLTHPRTRAVTRGSLTGRCPGLHAAETQLLEAQAGPLPRLCPALSPRGQLPGTGPLGWICTSCEGQAPRPAQGCGLRAGMLQARRCCGGARRNPEQGCCGTYTSTGCSKRTSPRLCWASPGLPFSPAALGRPSLPPRQSVYKHPAWSGSQGLAPKTDSQGSLRLSPHSPLLASSPSCFPLYMHIYMLP